MRNCILILPYFGEFNNYFELFLNSCKYNQDIDWIIITDNRRNYDYPKNVHIKYMVFSELKNLISSKFDFEIALESPYKLCDFKPAYGFIFEELISEYSYWGHCDCDLIFGELNKFLFPLFDEGYDKIFAAGHLTLYKNTYRNNRRFQKPLKGELLYRYFLAAPQICWFDEDWKDANIHAIFLEDHAKVCCEDYCINPSVDKSQFVLQKYDKYSRSFIGEPYKKSLYVWDRGSIKRITSDETGNGLSTSEHIYMHLQHRKMRVNESALQADTIQIRPNSFTELNGVPESIEEWSKINKEPINSYMLDRYVLRAKNKLRRMSNRK